MTTLAFAHYVFIVITCGFIGYNMSQRSYGIAGAQVGCVISAVVLLVRELWS